MFDRRELLRRLGLGGLGLSAAAAGMLPAACTSPRLAKGSDSASRAGRSVRFAHLTDIHVQPELRADAGLVMCLEHVMNTPATGGGRPEIVITGGDLVFDSFAQEFGRTRALWELYSRSFQERCGLEVQHTLGNHDIWGWNKGKSKTSGSEPQWGKRWFCEMASRDRSYQAFDRGRWRIIQLDSVHTDPRDADGYIGKLDEEQMAWLDQELAAIPDGRYACIVSHIPILSLCAMVFDGSAKQKELRWEVGAGNMHIDGVQLHKKFVASGKVKLCLSGHIHKLDRVEMNGVTYMCNGAVSGAWWRGRGDRCDEGYAMMDLFDDGSFAREYVTYGWKAEA